MYKATVQSHKSQLIVRCFLFWDFLFSFVLFVFLSVGIVVFSLFGYLFFCFFCYCFFFFCLFVSWFPFVCSFCLVCFFFFSRWKGYFNFLVGRVNDSCSAGQSMSYVSILEAYNSFVGRWEGLDVSKKSFIIVYIPIYFFTNYL